MKSTQRGLSLIGLLVVGGMLAFLGVVAAQAVPVMLEYQAIIKASKKAAQETTVATVRAAFDRAQAIDDFSSVAGKDLEITKEADKVVVETGDMVCLHTGFAQMLLEMNKQPEIARAYSTYSADVPQLFVLDLHVRSY